MIENRRAQREHCAHTERGRCTAAGLQAGRRGRRKRKTPRRRRLRLSRLSPQDVTDRLGCPNCRTCRGDRPNVARSPGSSPAAMPLCLNRASPAIGRCRRRDSESQPESRAEHETAEIAQARHHSGSETVCQFWPPGPKCVILEGEIRTGSGRAVGRVAEHSGLGISRRDGCRVLLERVGSSRLVRSRLSRAIQGASSHAGWKAP